ncbi:M20/M25/M40 family metallo-hydrolase [Alkalicoccus halolimnae]|uniref:M20/M25/M40 family metallo-hydrolase n=1 Tax=Alkalicoccus halolimnae TaxID=1667239 RepID=A0A5C7FBK5_9BACI|nr:M20/M25/M40 family metallo-hydrolase [Alkalicoccus halolimnae]TXF86808.1 M20/M25/M40 family metallo-hydrolase [Alkalicoccus halolimnae]
MLWNTSEAMEELLCEMVGWESRTFSQGEKDFPVKLQEKLKTLPYFKHHKDHVVMHDADKGRRSLTALYRHPDREVTKTIVLLSHFDTVQTEEYGHLEPLAFDPKALTLKLHEEPETLPEAARVDLESDEYLFGRGTMDMKMGLVLHLHTIEQAIEEEWKLNLLIVTVPDEEVDSIGMRTVVPELLRLKQQYDLDFSLFLNSEPSFTQHPGDNTHYIYSGSMGKIMPAALFFGKETHVGEPLSGITATYMSSFVSQEMEWNPAFREKDLGETTPLPVSLQLRDLKLKYSTQTPYRAASLYNVFTMKKDAASIMDTFTEVVEKAMERCNNDYRKLCEREDVRGVGDTKVIRYEDLYKYVQEKFSDSMMEEAVRTILEVETWDDREQSIRLAGEWMLLCPELAPAVIVFYAPPYYPPVNSSHEEGVKEGVEGIEKVASAAGFHVEHIHYFNGICDLSYVNYQKPEAELDAYRSNTPLWGKGYSIPFEEMRQLQAPVLNVGPFGKDPHQRTERLHKKNAFVHTPEMLHELLRIWQQNGKVEV